VLKEKVLNAKVAARCQRGTSSSSCSGMAVAAAARVNLSVFPWCFTTVAACSSTHHLLRCCPPAVTAHLTGLHSAVKMLTAKLSVIQQQVQDVAEGEAAAATGRGQPSWWHHCCVWEQGRAGQG
jgi:hypothetical protein